MVIHNDEEYGAAGASIAGNNLATASIHEYASLIAAHELYHSMFIFYDEYNISTPSRTSNDTTQQATTKHNNIKTNKYGPGGSVCTSKKTPKRPSRPTRTRKRSIWL